MKQLIIVLFIVQMVQQQIRQKQEHGAIPLYVFFYSFKDLAIILSSNQLMDVGRGGQLMDVGRGGSRSK